ncbi:glycosyltransferase family A protein [Micromonospora pisi]|uniref:glycosyltransferase family A protein n=1 Tax=Micromonospora pisi TaxID=589240 RepID=UPI001B882C51|nr:glycosyltransferase family A protein [Micromonospora pisi]
MAILVPMLGRPHRVAPLLESIAATTPGAEVLFVVSPDDVAVHAEIDAAGRRRVTVPWRGCGDYQRKINFGIRATTAPLLFTAADDLRFHPGWLNAAHKRLAAGIGVVGTNDLANKRVLRGDHATHMLVTREYVTEYGTIDEPGKFLHEGYPHEWCDDEAVATAKHRKAWAFARDAVVEHLHPTVGKAPMDPLYAQQGHRMAAGRSIFNRRRRLWT